MAKDWQGPGVTPDEDNLPTLPRKPKPFEPAPTPIPLPESPRSASTPKLDYTTYGGGLAPSPSPSAGPSPRPEAATSSATLPPGWSIGSDGNPGHYRPDGGWESVPWDRVPTAAPAPVPSAPAPAPAPSSPAPAPAPSGGGGGGLPPGWSIGSDGNPGYFRPDGGWESVPGGGSAPTAPAPSGGGGLPPGWSIGSDGNPGYFRPDGGWQSVPGGPPPSAPTAPPPPPPPQAAAPVAPTAPPQANPIQPLIDELLKKTQQKDDENKAIKDAQRARLLELLGTNVNDASITDADLKPQADAYALAQYRAMQQQRAMLAERAAAAGLNTGGAGSGAFDTNLQGLAEQAGEKSAAFNADLVGRKLTERRAQLMQGLQLADAIGARQEANALQAQLAAIDAQLRQTALSLSDQHFYDQLGFDYSNLLTGANRDALLTLLG